MAGEGGLFALHLLFHCRSGSLGWTSAPSSEACPVPSDKAITYGTAGRLIRFISSTAPGSSSLSSTVIIRHLLGVEDGCVLPPFRAPVNQGWEGLHQHSSPGVLFTRYPDVSIPISPARVMRQKGRPLTTGTCTTNVLEQTAQLLRLTLRGHKCPAEIILSCSNNNICIVPF